MQRTEREQWRAVARLFSQVEAERSYFQEIVASLPVGVAIYSRELTLVSANRFFRQTFGPSAAGLTAGQLLPTDSLRQAAALAVGSPAPAPVSEEVALPDGRVLRITLLSFCTWDESEEPELLVVAEDISGPVHRSADRLDHQLDLLHVLTWEIEPQRFEFLRSDAHAAERLGLDPAAWTTGASFWRRVTPDDLSRTQAIYQSALRGGPVEVVWYRSADSKGHLRWLRDSFSVIRDANGGPLLLRGVTIDVTTDQQLANLNASATRGAAVARLASQVVHEGNNLLMILGGYSESLLQGLPADSPLRSDVEQIVAATGRLSQLTSALVPYTRKQPEPEAAPVAVDGLLAGKIDSWNSELPAGVSLQFHPGSDGSMVRADASQLAQCVRFLIQRAAHVQLAGGALRLTTGVRRVGVAAADDRDWLAAGEYVSLSVADSGLAIPAEQLARLFEPDTGGDAFTADFSTARHGFRRLGGELLAESEAGRGSEFTILLPRLVGAAIAAGPQRETVLVVDDEASIRTLMTRFLEREGYRVLEAANGDEALEIAAAHREPIPLLLTDIVMPRMSGVELAESVVASRPETRVLFVSGYTGQASLSGARIPRGFDFVQKPFTLAGLTAKVREILDRPAARGQSA